MLEPSAPINNASTPEAGSGIDFEKIKSYGKVGIAAHLAISWTILGLTYLLVSRTTHSQRLIKFLKLQARIPKQAGSFAIAAIIYKCVMPARIGLSLVVIPVLISKFNLGGSSEAHDQLGKVAVLSQAGLALSQ